jgi:hypothetical protein
VLGPAGNAGFYRPEADLAILIFSDENDYSTLLTLTQMETWLAGLKAAPAKVTVDALVSPGVGCGSSWGSAYPDLASRFGGLHFSICDGDMASDLAQIGTSLIPPPFDGILVLAHPPDLATVAVTVTEPLGAVVSPLVGVDWDFDPVTNAVVFNGLGYWPPLESKIEVTYRAVP